MRKSVSEPLFPLFKLLPFSEFTLRSEIQLTQVQKQNYYFFRCFGENFFQSLAYIYLEEILGFGTLPFIMNWIEFLRSENSDIFKNLYFKKKVKGSFDKPEFQKAYYDAEQAFFSVFEKYVDSILTKQVTEKKRLSYDFLFKCLESEQLRLFCKHLPRKMVSGYYHEEKSNKELNKQLANSKNIWDLEDNSFSFGDILLVSAAINFRIDVFQAARKTELKREDVKLPITTRQAYGKLCVMVFENQFFGIYEKNESVELYKQIEVEFEKAKKALKIQESQQKRKKSEENKEIPEKSSEKKKKPNFWERSEGNEALKQEEIIVIQSDEDEQEEPKNPQSIVPDSEPLQKMPSNRGDEHVKVQKSVVYQEKCFHCRKTGHGKKLFEIKFCGHTICFDCMVNKYYKTDEIHHNHYCPADRCPRYFYLEQIQDYFQEILMMESECEAGKMEEEKKELRIEENEGKKTIEIENPSANIIVRANDMEIEKNPQKNREKEVKFKESFAEKPFFKEKPSKEKPVLNEEKPLRKEKPYSNEKPPSSNEKPPSSNEKRNSRENPKLAESPNLQKGSDHKISRGLSSNPDEIISMPREKSTEMELESDIPAEDEKTFKRLKKSAPADKGEAHYEKNEMSIESPPESGLISVQEHRILCVSCWKSVVQSQVFSNPFCSHCYCYDCVLEMTKRTKDYSYCSVRQCFKLVKKEYLETFIEDFTSRNDPLKTKIVSQTCFVCGKESQMKIGINSEVDSFKCRFCSGVSCLIHKAEMKSCFCCCECGEKTESDFIKNTRKICGNCRNKYCVLCKQALFKCNCYCNRCSSVIERADKKCGECEKFCQKCGVGPLAEGKLMRAEKCGHAFCRECGFDKLERLRKYGCVLDHYFSYK